MKLSIRLILFLVAGITVVTFIVSKNEVRWHKRGLRADLERRAEILSESLQEIVEPASRKAHVTNSAISSRGLGIGSGSQEWSFTTSAAKCLRKVRIC
jgi:hypothetical protein